MTTESPDIFIPKPGHGAVYGLFDYAEPLQIRYVGQTQKDGKSRLVMHENEAKTSQTRKSKWIREVKAAGGRIGMRLLGEYPLNELMPAERKWITFWKGYCDLLNRTHRGSSNRPVKGSPRRRLRSTESILQDVTALLEDPANRATIARAVELLKTPWVG